MNKKHILVVGTGSVGQRHLRNFASLGCHVSGVDPRFDRLNEAAQAVSLAGQFTQLEDALKRAGSFSAVLIASPTRYHIDQTLMALDAGLPVFLEKPLSMDASSAVLLRDAVRRSSIPVFLGYTYRWWPPIQDLKAHLDASAIGKVFHAQCTMSAHLADWHPWERYQDFFMASKELGGGALLDESHFLDLMLWFFGMPSEVFARIEHLSSLEIETDDNVDAWLGYPNGLRIMIHLDLFGRPHERAIVIRGDQGSLHWTYTPNRLRFGSSDANWQDTMYTCERNEMFLGAAREFLDTLETGKSLPCTVEDGYSVMHVLDAMRRSSSTGRVVSLNE